MTRRVSHANDRVSGTPRSTDRWYNTTSRSRGRSIGDRQGVLARRRCRRALGRAARRDRSGAWGRCRYVDGAVAANVTGPAVVVTGVASSSPHAASSAAAAPVNGSSPRRRNASRRDSNRTAHSAATSATTHSLTAMPERYGTVRGDSGQTSWGLLSRARGGRTTTQHPGAASTVPRCAAVPNVATESDSVVPIRARSDRLVVTDSLVVPWGCGRSCAWTAGPGSNGSTALSVLAARRSRSHVVSVTPSSWSRRFSTFSVGVRGSWSTTSM